MKLGTQGFVYMFFNVLSILIYLILENRCNILFPRREKKFILLTVTMRLSFLPKVTHMSNCQCYLTSESLLLIQR